MFKRIKAKNIFSWKSLDYEVKPGISQISGFNYDDGTPEGSGKSSISNILTWTLYGKIPKDVKIDDVIKEGEKSCSGEVTLDNEIVICRTRKPNDLIIIAPNGTQTRGKDAKETQEMIEKLIGMSFDTFCQSIYFAQNYEKKFISANETEKAKILSEIQDLTIFDSARKQVMTDLSSAQKSLSNSQQSLYTQEKILEEVISKKQMVDRHISDFQAQKSEKLHRLEEKKTNALNKLVESETLLSNCDMSTLREARTQLENMHDAINNSKASIKHEISQIQTTQKKLDSAKNSLLRITTRIQKLELELNTLTINKDECPLCGGVLEDKHKAKLDSKKAELKGYISDEKKTKKVLEDEIKSYDIPSLEELQKQLKEVEVESLEISNALSKLTAEESEIKNLQNKLVYLVQQVDDVDSEINSLKLSNCDKDTELSKSIQEKIKQSQKTIEDTQNTITEIGKYISNLEILKSGFKDVKSFVFQNLLVDLSNKSTEFARDLFEIPVSIRFYNNAEDGDVTKILCDVNLDGVSRSLGLLSGGQYRRVQLSVDLALSKIVGSRSKNPINFRILDEACKDLSEVSMEKMVKLLKNLQGSTILIEHNSIIKSIVDEVFEVSLRNGTSSREEDS